MKKRFLLFLLLTISIDARYWDSEFDQTLKKDEVAQFTIFDPAREKTFSFRWTLFINNGLIVLANYDGFPYQFILYKDYHRRSFKIPLYKRDSYLMVEFSDFDLEKREATFKTMFRNSKAEELKKDSW